MFERTVISISVAVLVACGDTTDGDQGGGTETDAASGSSSSDGTGGAADAPEAEETGSEAQCAAPTAPSIARWEMLADPDHLRYASSVVSLEDGGIVVAGGERIMQYDAQGKATAVTSPSAQVRGVGPSTGAGDFVALLDDDEALRLVSYAGGEEVRSSTAPFATGVVGYRMPLVVDGEATVVTIQRTDDEAVGMLQLRDGALDVTAEFEVNWTLDLWAARAGTRTFVAMLDGAAMRVAAFEDAAEAWSTSLSTSEEDAWRFPTSLAIQGGLVVHSGSSDVPLRSLDLDDGTELWSSTVNPALMTTTSCGDVFALVTGDDVDALYRIEEDGPLLVTELSRNLKPHAGDSTPTAMSVDADGTVYVARSLLALESAHNLLNLKSY